MKATPATGYQAFIASLELYTIGLADISGKINREEYWKKDDEHATSYSVSSRPLDTGNKVFEVRSTLTLQVVGEKSKTTVVTIIASYDLHFHSDSASRECVEKFCESDVLLVVMPYFRELVSDITSKMHIPPITLPLSTK